MDRSDLNPYSPQLHTNDRPIGAFGQLREPPPKPVQTWIAKAGTVLLNFKWEKPPAEEIIDSLELHTNDYVVTAVKRREALDKTDNQNSAQALFALNRTNLHEVDAEVMRGYRTAPAPNANQAALTIAAAALETRQQARITTLAADAASAVVEADRSALTLYCSLSIGELSVYREFVRARDAALCHFLFYICEPDLMRYLNAERIKADAAGAPLKWDAYKALLYVRLKD